MLATIYSDEYMFSFRDQPDPLGRAQAAARGEFGNWFDPELVEHYIEGLRKAGLEFSDSEVAPKRVVPAKADSDTFRRERSSGFARSPATDSGSKRRE